VAKAAKAARAAVKAAPIAAATAPGAAGGLGFVLLALGAVWAISRVTGPIEDIFKGAGAVIRAPSEFGAGLLTGERAEREVPITKYQLDPDVQGTHFTVRGSGVTVTNPSPHIPPPRFYEFDQPSAAREAGIYIRGNIDDAISVSEYTGDPFTGKIPGGPKFDLLAPFRGLFGGEGEPKSREYAPDLLYGEPKSREYAADLLYGEPKSRGYAADLLYRGEPTQTVTLPFKGEIPEMIYT